MNVDGSGVTRLTNNCVEDGYPAWSPDGAKIAFRSGSSLSVMNADGSGQVALVSEGGPNPSWSPDGTKIAFVSRRDGNNEVYVMNADGSAQTNLTNNSTNDHSPSWSPDGSQIAFTSSRDATYQTYIMNSDGSGLTNLTDNSDYDDYDPSWSPDGTKIAFDSNMGGPCREIYVMNVDGSGRTRLTYECSSGGALSWSFAPSWSPNGAGIVFTSTRDDMNLIYVMNADGSGQTNISNSGECCGYREYGPSWGQ